MEKINREAIDEFVNTAYKSGLPKDQVENFLTKGYVPLRWQCMFHAEARKCDNPDGATELGAGGARGPGKSHCVFSQVTLDDCQRKDGLKFLFLRQTGKAARESFEDLILRVLTGRVEYNYNISSGFLSFHNGSRVLLGGFESERDIDKYIGIEYDGIAIEELNQLTKNKVDKLLGSMRTSRTDWRPRLYTSFNPGGIGHQYVKDEFVTPFREGKEAKTRFIPSTYKDNPYLNREYIDYLEGLSGNLGKAWREGEFDLFEGQFFIEFSREKHVVSPFAIPESWLRFRSIDPSGRDGITSCHWYALDWNRRVFCYREHYGTGLDADQHALEITRLSQGEQYRYTVIDSAAFSKLGLPETMAEIYNRCGVSGLTPSSKQRVVGWNTVHTYLRWDKNTTPKLFIFSTCENMIRTIPALVHDDLHPEDINNKGEDHAADELRYFLQTLREGHTPRPLTFVERRLKEMKEKEEEFNLNYTKSSNFLMK